jgi:hypothetical protein
MLGDTAILLAVMSHLQAICLPDTKARIPLHEAAHAVQGFWLTA